MTNMENINDRADNIVSANTDSIFTIRNVLSVIIVLSFVGLIVMMNFFPPKGDSSTYSLFTTLIGFLGAAFGTVVQYHLGSSKGSEDKNDTIKQLVNTGNSGTGPSVTDSVTSTTKVQT